MNQTEQSQVVQILSIVSGMLVPLGVIVTAILTYLNGRKITEVKAQTAPSAACSMPSHSILTAKRIIA